MWQSDVVRSLSSCSPTSHHRPCLLGTNSYCTCTSQNPRDFNVVETSTCSKEAVSCDTVSSTQVRVAVHPHIQDMIIRNTTADPEGAWFSMEGPVEYSHTLAHCNWHCASLFQVHACRSDALWGLNPVSKSIQAAPLVSCKR
jgi:hypothetical protein